MSFVERLLVPLNVCRLMASPGIFFKKVYCNIKIIVFCVHVNKC